MNANRLADLRLFGLLIALYFAQGLPSGLLGKALPALLREQGVSLSAIGFTSLLALPWALKFLWAPFIDRYGTRRRWLLLLNGLVLGLMLLVATRDFADWVAQAFVPLLAILFCINLVAATQDIATDGLAVSRLTPRLRGLGNSVQVIGYKIGMLIGGGLLLWLVDRYGWERSYAGIAALLVLVLLPVLLMRDETPEEKRQASHGADSTTASTAHPPWRGPRGYARLFADLLTRPGMGWWLLAVATFKLGDALASRMIGPLLTDIHLSLADIAVLTGVTGTIAGMAGAFLGGVFLLRTGHRNALLLFGSLQALGLFGYTFIAQGLHDLSLLYTVVCFEQFADGLSTVALFTLMMDRCRMQSPGTDYTLQASLQVTVAGFATLASGVVADATGYSTVFISGGVLTLCALVPVLMYFRVAGRAATGAAT